MFNFTMNPEGSSGTLTLAGSLTIQRAQELKAALLEAAGQAQQVHLNLEQVSDVDLAAIQLVCALHRQLQGTGKKLTVMGKIPPAFSRTVELSGYKVCAGDGDTSGLWTGVSN